MSGFERLHSANGVSSYQLVLSQLVLNSQPLRYYEKSGIQVIIENLNRLRQDPGFIEELRNNMQNIFDELWPKTVDQTQQIEEPSASRSLSYSLQ